MAAAAEVRGVDEAGDITHHVRAAIDARLKGGVINPWCGICRAPATTWRYELRRTKFATMDAAEPEMRKSEEEQAVIRALFAGE